MPRFGLCGPSYASQSLNADAQITMNLYPEIDESGAGNAPIMLYPTPGLKARYILNNPPVRGSLTITGRTLVVSGQDCLLYTSPSPRD